MPDKRLLPYLIALLAGLLALSVPLLRDFHIESAVPAALVGAFYGAVFAATRNSPGDWRGLGYVMSVIYTAALPILVSNMANGCFTISGLGFWVFYPSVSVYFGYAMGRYFRNTGFNKPVLYSILTLVAIAVGIWLIEIYHLPQVYFHNHVWGGWPGTIYDVEIEFTASELFFRAITFTWASLLWLAPTFWENSYSRYGVALFTVSLMLSYSQLSQAGIASPREYLQAELGGFYETEHFHIYYSKHHFTDYDLRKNAALHEFHLKEIAETLEVDLPSPDNKIESYLYGHPWQMKKLVGAKNVSYVPVWSSVDQLHVGKNAIERTLRHELVHGMAKQFGNAVIKASWSIGLVEGLAVALAPASRQITTADQTVAANRDLLTAGEVRSLLSPTGFYTGRGAVNYTTAGSLVGYLLREHPVEYFKKAYQSAGIEQAYPQPLDSIVKGWHQYIATVEFDMREQEAGEQLFATPSIFEADCPRSVSPEHRLTDRYLYYMAEADTAAALHELEGLLQLNPDNYNAWRFWATMNFSNNKTMWDVVPDHHPHNPFYLIKQADFAMLNGIPSEAKSYLDQFETTINGRTSSEFRAMLQRRSDSRNWHQLVDGLYRTSEITREDFEAMGNNNRFYTMQKMLRQNNRDDILEFIRLLAEKPYDASFFDIFLQSIEYALLNDDPETGKHLNSFLENQSLRPLEKEKLKELSRFSTFLEKYDQGSFTIPNAKDIAAGNLRPGKNGRPEVIR
ncbi:MAG: hypothetical protein WDZ53_11055 [Balneolales bacterium]